MLVTASAPTLAVSMRVLMVVVVRMAMPAAAAAFSVMVVIVPVVMTVIMIVGMIMSAPASIAMVMMLVRIGENSRQPALERDRLLARRIPRFDGERHHFCADAKIVHLPEVMPTKPSLPVENENRRRALNLVSLHGLRQALAVRLVERDGKR